jgi:hypothetical protein
LTFPVVLGTLDGVAENGVGIHDLVQLARCPRDHSGHGFARPGVGMVHPQ